MGSSKPEPPYLFDGKIGLDLPTICGQCQFLGPKMLRISADQQSCVTSRPPNMNQALGVVSMLLTG